MTKTMNYPYIKAWGMYMGSYAYYIRDQQERAQQQNAPADAIYERHHPLDDNDPEHYGHSGVWARFSELSEYTQREVQRTVAERGFEIELIPCLQ